MKSEITYLRADMMSLGTIIRIKSHNARDNVSRICPSMRGLLSIKFAFYGKHHAADSFYSISAEDAQLLRGSRGRWLGSVGFPKRVPDDLDFRTGGMWG